MALDGTGLAKRVSLLKTTSEEEQFEYLTRWVLRDHKYVSDKGVRAELWRIIYFRLVSQTTLRWIAKAFNSLLREGQGL